MKDYNYEENLEIYHCKACGYSHIRNYTTDVITQGDEEFFVLGSTIKKSNDFYSLIFELRISFFVNGIK
jgi:hypothetical protein